MHYDKQRLSLEQKALKREYIKLEKDYQKAVIGANIAKINEIRIDQNDGLRTRILGKTFYDIKKKYRGFKEDHINAKEILFNNTLEQEKKL